MDKSNILWFVLIAVGVWVGLLPTVPEARRAYKAHLVALVHWFWGHRSSYSLFEGDNKEIKVSTSNLKLRSDSSRYRHAVYGPVLEVNHGFWRRRSAIYGSGWRWKIWRTNYSRKKSAGEFVHLFDVWGLTPETALRLVNRYESLEAMLNRIAELELQLEASEERCSNLRFYATGWRSLVTRLYDKVAKPQDKRRFKGGDAREIVKELWLMIELQSKRELQTGL